MKRVGVYGGTFDPLHFGHLNLAIELKEKGSLDEVWFVPVQVNPHKQHALPTEIDHRLKMLYLALSDIKDFKIKETEVERPPPSYTIDTLRILIAENSHAPFQFYFLMGEDALQGLSRWHLIEEIVELVPLLIGSRLRTTDKIISEVQDPKVRQAVQKGLVQTRMMDISSTEVRMRLKKGLYCGHLVPSKILDYIQQHQLYSAAL